MKINLLKLAGLALSLVVYGIGFVQDAISDKQTEEYIDATIDEKLNEKLNQTEKTE